MNIPTTDYPALISIINQTYTSGIDAILAAKMVGQNKMLVLGQDGSKQLAVELSPKNIAIKWINSGQKPPKKGAESFSEVSLDDALLNAAVVSMAQLAGIDLPVSFSEAPVLDLDEEYAEGKAFKCSPKSISCKGRCISGWKVCRDGLNPGQIKQLDGLMKKAKKGDQESDQILKTIKGGQFGKELGLDDGLSPEDSFDDAVKVGKQVFQQKKKDDAIMDELIAEPELAVKEGKGKKQKEVEMKAAMVELGEEEESPPEEAKPKAIDSQKPPSEPPPIKSIADLEAYTAAWQKDRGYDEATGGGGLGFGPGIQIHDINHPLLYLSTGRSPESISKDYGHPGTPYNGKPNWAEETFVALAERAFIKDSNRDLAIADVMDTFVEQVKKSDAIRKTMSKEEADFYMDEPKRRDDLEKMYDELQKAKSEHKALLKKNNKRLFTVEDAEYDDAWIGMTEDEELDKKYKKKSVFTNFAEEGVEKSGAGRLGRKASGRLAVLLAIANISGKRRSYADLVKEAREADEEEEPESPEDHAEMAAMAIPEADYPELVKIINGTYSDGIDKILAAKLTKGGEILVVAQDGLKQLAIQIKGDEIAIKSLSQKAPKGVKPESFEEALDAFDWSETPAVAEEDDSEEEYKEGKAFKCKPENISCKGRCISGWKVCRDGMDQGQIKQLDGLMKRYRRNKSDVEAAAMLGQIKYKQSQAQKGELGADVTLAMAMNIALKDFEKPAPQPDATVIPAPPSGIAEISPEDIAVDPKRFQYKLLGEHTTTGEVGSLSGVKKYDPDLAGIVQVWHDPADGKTYVVNGHNRLALANKLGAESVAVRYLKAPDAQAARAIGAITNIAEGRGDALDAAKFFRDSGISREDLEAKGIPMREKIAQDGLALSKLDDSLFQQTINGGLSINRAAIIGGGGLDHAQQRDLAKLIDSQGKKKALTDATIQEMVDIAKGSESQQEVTLNLFGEDFVQKTNMIEKAKLQAAIKSRLSREKSLFGVVSKSKAAAKLEEAGNQINIGKSKDISEKAEKALATFDQLKNLSGPISQAINKAADRVAKGENAKTVEQELYDSILSTEIISGAKGGGA